jgi:hypothetical protein
MLKNKRNAGQALIEYVFIFLFSATLVFQGVNKFSEFFRDSLGSLAHVLSMNLVTGICSTDCYYDGYRNTYKGAGN